MILAEQTQQKLCYDIQPVIAVGETTSDAVDVHGTSILAFITDVNLTGSSFTFLASDSFAGTYVPLKDMATGDPLTSFTGTSAQYATQPADFASVQYLKIVMNTNQLTTPTTITLVTRTLA
jgi:hypothetical protein